MKERILIIDDDIAIRDGSAQVLKRLRYEVVEASTGTEAVSCLDKYEFDLILLDLFMPDINGLDLLKTIRERDPLVQVIMITAYGTVQNAVEAMRLGANDFLPKPFEPDELKFAAERAFRARKLAMENLFLKEELRRKEGGVRIVGQSEALKLLLEQAERVANTDSTVLITGESGTGKGLLARYIHSKSQRRDYPFVSVDCSTLVPSLFESELFGHVKGAFTGATSNRVGKFEMANDGTLFLDEIGNVSLEQQAKLLKAVEEKEISRVGSSRLTKVDARIIAATNQDLRKAVREGSFREDLFFRLNVVALHIAPIRERIEDIRPLISHFLKKFSLKHERAGLKISGDAMELLEQYSWPGNVREIENAVERLVIFASGDLIDEEDVELAGLPALEQTGGSVAFGGHFTTYELVPLEDVEKEYILKVLKEVGGKRTEAASILGIDRKTLRLKLKRWGI